MLEKLLNIQQNLKAPKGQKNSFGNYNYRSCEDILEAVKPLLKENKCVLTLNDEMEQIGERYYIKATATLYDVESDKTISNSAYAREEEIKKGMDASQITGATSSYARKYALNGLFDIDDTKDADTDEYQKQTKEITTIEQAKEYRLTFGKHSGESLLDINEEAPDYIEWLIKNSNDTNVLTCIELLFNKKKSDYEVDEETLLLTSQITQLTSETNVDLETIKEKYGLKDLRDATKDQLKEIKELLIKQKTILKKISEKEGK